MKDRISLTAGFIIGVWRFFTTLRIDVAQFEKMFGAFVYGALGGAGTWVGLKLVKLTVKYLGSFWRYIIYKIKQ